MDITTLRKVHNMKNTKNTAISFFDLKRQYHNIENEIIIKIKTIFESQKFILGDEVKNIERDIAEYCGSKYAIGVSSGSDALLAVLMALNIGHNDEIITTPFTFFATAGAITRLGAKPVFADSMLNDYNIDPNKISELITKKTKAIIPVHLYGQLCEIEKIVDIGIKYGIPVIEDAAQAIGASFNNYKAGTFGLAGCLSFFPTKNLGCFGDGGMVITNDTELYKKLKQIRVHGMGEKYLYDVIGGNFRLDELQAGILSIKLKILEKLVESRRKNAERYRINLAGCKNIILPTEKNGYFHVYNQFVIRIGDRDKIQELMKKSGIGTEKYYPLPLHLQKCFRYLNYREGDFPVSEKLSKEVLALPIYPELEISEIDYISNKLIECSDIK